METGLLWNRELCAALSSPRFREGLQVSFPSRSCGADEGGDGGAGWTDSEASGTEYVSVSLKMQHAFTSTPHISTLEKWSVRFLLRSGVSRQMTTPCSHARPAKWCFLSGKLHFRIFELLIPRFSSPLLLLSYTTCGYVWANWTFQHSFITSWFLRGYQAEACL